MYKYEENFWKFRQPSKCEKYIQINTISQIISTLSTATFVFDS